MPRYRGTDNVFKSYYAGVPWWWSSAPYIQTYMAAFNGIPMTVFVTLVAVSAVGTAVLGLWPVAVALSLIVGLHVAYGIYFANRPLVGELDPVWDKAEVNELRVNEYLKLPKKLRQELRPMAKIVDKDEALTESWAAIVDGYLAQFTDSKLNLFRFHHGILSALETSQAQPALVEKEREAINVS